MQMESFELGEYSVHPSLNAVQVNGREIGVESKAMEVLVYLAGQPGNVIDKEQIIKAVWPDTFVSDDVLTHAISHLRKALNDDAAHPRFIQTIPRRGYRLIAPVVREARILEQNEAAKPPPLQPASPGWKILALSLSLVLLVALAGFVLLNRESEMVKTELVNPRAVTTAQGVEDYPSWRPDGTQLAYESQQAGNYDIWVTGIGGGIPVNLTADHQGADRWPSWSPDGSQIAFWSNRDGGGYFTVPSLGGKARKVIAVSASSMRPGPPQWSPDSLEVAFTRLYVAPQVYAIEIVSVRRGTSRRHPLPLAAAFPGYSLKWSPDGRHFAYATAADDASPTSQVCIFRLADQKVFEVTDGETLDWNPAWSMDGQSLYFVSNRGGSMDLWRQNLMPDGTPSGVPQALTTGLEVRYAVFSPDGKRLAYSKGQDTSNLWSVPALSERPPTWADARQLTFDQSGLGQIDLSPDLRHLSFDMYRDGRRHVWLLPVAGGDLHRLTTHPTNEIWPRWSPDGSAIAFHATAEAGERDVWIAPVRGGPLRQLTRHPRWDIDPEWAPNGRKIAFNSNRTGNWDVWIVSVETGEERQLTTDKGLDFACCSDVWSPDGKEVVFISDRKGTADIWIVSVEDGKERRIASTEGRVFASSSSWSPSGEWILHHDGSRLNRIPPSGGEPVPLSTGSQGFWSKDGKRIYFRLRNNVFELSIDNGRERQLTDLKGRYGVLGRSVVTNGTHFYFSWFERAADLWVMDVKPQ